MRNSVFSQDVKGDGILMKKKYRNVVLHPEGCSSNSKSLGQRLNEKEDLMLTEKMKEKSAL